jgi:monovalent cation:H+ antiporter-2, CPA2 family
MRTREALVVAGVVGISSSAIVTKLLVETRRLANPETRVILGIIVIEDVFLAFYLALLQPVLGEASGTGDAVLRIGTAFAFLLGLFVIARHGARLANTLIATKHEEIVVIISVGLAIITAGIAEQLGVSDAIGAFMIGLILSATAFAKRLRTLTHPLRDAFAAIFFFHFGLTIDPGRRSRPCATGRSRRPDDRRARPCGRSGRGATAWLRPGTRSQHWPHRAAPR